MTGLRFLCCLGLIVALAGTEGRASARSDPSSWTIGAALGATTTLFPGEFTYRYRPQPGG